MTPAFIILAVLTLAGAVAAMTLRNLVHCALALVLALAGLAGLYLELQAQFVGFVQLLVYVGAVAILVVFAILLTRGSEGPREPIFSFSWMSGVATTLAVFGVVAGVVLSSNTVRAARTAAAEATVREIGDELMTRYVLPLEVLGILLTAALIGAVIIGMRERGRE